MFSHLTKFQLKLLIALYLLCTGLEWAVIHFKIIEKFSPTISSAESLQPLAPLPPPEKVVIGLVTCQSPKKSTPERVFYGMEINEEALIAIKSVLISARLYHVPKVDFHIFIEKSSDPAWFHKQLAKNHWTEDVGVEVQLFFHSAIDAVPDQYKWHMVFHMQYRCGFVRMFFPSSLPEVDSIIYFDTDMIVTGNIAELWQRLGQMKGEQVIGVARNNEPDNVFVDHLPGFGDILPLHKEAPKGLNSGMLVMNLTKMREVRWQERFLRMWSDYHKIYPNLEDQRTLNLFTYFDPGQLLLVPCSFDLIHTNCDFGWFCDPVLEDPYGVQVVHGAGNQFEGTGRFKSLFRAYQTFSWRGTGKSDKAVRDTFIKKIARPVRKSYEIDNRKGRSDAIKADSKCYGTLNKLLFKNLFKVK